MGELGAQLPTQVLADQITLYQPEGADCAPPPHYYLPTQLSVASYAPVDMCVYIHMNDLIFVIM